MKEQVQIIIFRKKKDKKEFLLLKRVPKKGGFWQPVCGCREKSDPTILYTVFREIHEETGLTSEKFKKMLFNVHSFVMDKNYLSGEPCEPITEYVFGLEVEADTLVDIKNNVDSEHEEVKWVDFDTAIMMLKWEDNKTGFKKLQDRLNNQ